MKLHFNISNGFHLENIIHNSNNFSGSKNLNKISINKLSIAKLKPHHWFDGIWDDLDFKM